jgi:hypothetical protein
MTRFDYLRREGAFARLRDALRLPATLRWAVLGGTAASAVIAGAATFELHRERDIVAELAQLHARAAALEPSVRRADELRRTLQRLRALREARAAARAGSLAGLDVLALIGNRWPAGSWLTGLQSQGGRWSFEGRALDLTSVGTALTLLAGIDARARVRVVSIDTFGTEQRWLRFTIAWERPR